MAAQHSLGIGVDGVNKERSTLRSINPFALDLDTQRSGQHSSLSMVKTSFPITIFVIYQNFNRSSL
jgi:hypothetical protein